MDDNEEFYQEMDDEDVFLQEMEEDLRYREMNEEDDLYMGDIEDIEESHKRTNIIISSNSEDSNYGCIGAIIFALACFVYLLFRKCVD
ncbi:MAG: hypothetical protein LBM08_02770 [Dysgonamonadaceae bacterium]|jgi:hypothetical protein|nr:hypothetical protein [Dysgonamonadaceae bacterium]